MNVKRQMEVIPTAAALSPSPVAALSKFDDFPETLDDV
jgi:hypothetical protein